MTLAFQSLIMMVLLVTGTVALLPVVLRDSVPRSTPSPRSGLRQPAMRIVETPGGQWYVNGALVPRGQLARLLRGQGGRAAAAYLPSDALPLGRVARSLHWLRSLAPGSVLLDLAPEARSRR